MKRFYSVSEVASRFDVTSQTVRNWIAGGRLSAVQPGRGGRYRITAPALDSFERATGLAPAEEPASMADARLDASVASELERIVQAIVESVHPDGVILFGSRARGDDRADSDFDLAIVAPDGSARRRVAKQAYESLAGVTGRSLGVDLVVLTPSIISIERDLKGSIARAVSLEGIVLYGSAEAIA
ncbi:MAG: nucleotidyltransferase domain-containing protein [Chloroflexota bacterium]